MQFPKEVMQELAGEDESSYEDSLLKKVESTLVDTTRWSNIYKMIFSYKDSHYRTEYSVGATECQDEAPFEYAPDIVEVIEVEQKEVVRIQWVDKKDG